MAWQRMHGRTAQVPLALALVAVALAGCSSPGDGPEGGGPGDPSAGLGVVEGVVVSQAIAPLAGAQLRLQPGNATSESDGDGAFRFAGLEPGAYTLEASLAGFLPVTLPVATGGSLVQVVLAPDTRALRYVESYAHDGFIDSSVNLAGTRSSSGMSPNFTFEGRLPDFVQIEMVWQSTQALGDEMDLTLVRNDGGTLLPSVGHAEGPSPLVASLDSEALNDPELGFGPGVVLDLFIFAGQEDVADGRGAGAMFQQPFTVFAHFFYGYAPPEGWRFSSDGEAPPPP